MILLCFHRLWGSTVRLTIHERSIHFWIDVSKAFTTQCSKGMAKWLAPIFHARPAISCWNRKELSALGAAEGAQPECFSREMGFISFWWHVCFSVTISQLISVQIKWKKGSRGLSIGNISKKGVYRTLGNWKTVLIIKKTKSLNSFRLTGW